MVKTTGDCSCIFNTYDYTKRNQTLCAVRPAICQSQKLEAAWAVGADQVLQRPLPQSSGEIKPGGAGCLHPVLFHARLVSMSYVRSYAEILDLIDQIDPVAYATTRNHLSGAVTRLSPYITRGIISLPFVRERLLAKHSAADCAKLIQELAWREYFQNVWFDRGDDIFSDIRFPRDDWRHAAVVSAVADAATGVQAMDAAIKELYDTGYMHNHMRMWVASVSCNLAYAHWHAMGAWLYYHLIDGDLASNFLSWQWVAGTSVNKRYTVNQALINACSDQQQAHSLLTFDREQMTQLPTPDILLPFEDSQLTTSYPDLDPLVTVSGATVSLYTPWTLDPTWRPADVDRRILVIDPVWFDRYPVSDLVLDFIIRQGTIVIPELEVHVGSVSDIHGISDALTVQALAHQTNQAWPVQFDQIDRLFPHVQGYYKSFFAYWKAVQAP